MALCVFAALPVFIILSIAQMKQMGFRDNRETVVVGASLVQDNVSNIRTVRAMNTMDDLLDKYKETTSSVQIGTCKAICDAITYAMNMSLQLVIMAGIYWVGGLMVRYGHEDFQNIMRAIFGIIFAAFGAAMASNMSGDLQKAKDSSKEVFEILNIDIDIFNDENALEHGNNIIGKIEFKNVWFKYPSRNQYVFKN